MSVLNNEVDILNVANIDNDIRDSYTRDMIAVEEKETYSTHNYDVNEFFIWNDRKLYKTLSAISTGDTFVLNTNIALAGNISDQLYQLFAQSPESIREVLSNVEEGSTASKNYHVGDYILWTDGFLYKVIANTNIGTAWTVGTNIQLKNNITDEITSLNSALTNIDTVISENGAKNLVPVTQTTQTFTKNGQTITFTVNPSGYPEGTVIVNGTYPEDIILSLYGSSTNRLIDAGILVKGKSYHISGCPSGGGDSTYWLSFNYKNAQSQVVDIKEQGSGIDVTIPSDSSGGGNLGVYIKENVTCNNVVFKPMITLASQPNSDYAHYVPYAMTNRELTAEMHSFTPTLKNCTATFTVQEGRYIKQGNLIYCALTLRGNMTAANGYAIIDISDIPFKYRNGFRGDNVFSMGSARMFSNVLDCKCVFVSPNSGEIHLRSVAQGTANWQTGGVFIDVEAIWFVF